MGDKGKGGVKNLKKWVTSLMDSSLFQQLFPLDQVGLEISFCFVFVDDLSMVRKIDAKDPHQRKLKRHLHMHL